MGTLPDSVAISQGGLLPDLSPIYFVPLPTQASIAVYPT
jgi:hypothetical protein